MKRIRIPALLAALLLLLSSCAAPDGGEEPSSAEEGAGEYVTFTDDLGRTVSLRPPKRVAAMIGSFAEVWCLAGGQESLVAASGNTWTSYDLGLREDVVNLGTINEPNLELLLAAQPDFIIASSNTASNVELEDTFASAGIPVAYFDVQDLDDYLRMLERCTQLTGDAESYERNGLAVQRQAEAVLARVPKRDAADAPKIVCLRVSGSSCKVKGSVDNVLGEMLADLGCINAADSDRTMLDSLSMEAVIAADPDYIFAVLQGSDTTDAQKMLEKSLLANPAWQSLRAVREGNFHLVEHSLYNLKPNARWGEAYEKLADILYPSEG